MKKTLILLLLCLLFSSCFLTKWQGVKYRNEIKESNKVTAHSFSDYNLFVFKMEEIKKSVSRNNEEISFVNGIDSKGERVVEEIYLLKNKNNKKVLYFTTEANKYSKTQTKEDTYKGYQAFYLLNSLYHKSAYFVQELDVIMQGEIKENKIIISNGALVKPNMKDDLIIIFKEYVENGNDIIEFITINNDHRSKKKRKTIGRVKLENIINMKMKFKASSRRLAYMKKGDSLIQYVDSFYTYKNDIYFSKNTKFDVLKNHDNFQYLLLKDRFLNDK